MMFSGMGYSDLLLQSYLEDGYELEQAEEQAYYTFLEIIGELDTMYAASDDFGCETELTIPPEVDNTPPVGWENVVTPALCMA